MYHNVFLQKKKYHNVYSQFELSIKVHKSEKFKSRTFKTMVFALFEHDIMVESL